MCARGGWETLLTCAEKRISPGEPQAYEALFFSSGAQSVRPFLWVVSSV